MPMVIGGKTYYRTAEVCHIAGLSRSTFFRWLRQRSFEDVVHFDRRGWRLFTKEDLKRLKAEVNQIKSGKKKQQDKNE